LQPPRGDLVDVGRASMILVAADAGPRETLSPLQEPLGTTLANMSSPQAATDAHWRGLIRNSGARGVVCGTSDSTAGRAVEACARRAAAAEGVPVAAIEDFPGNYCDVPGGAVTLLFVESDGVAALTRAKWRDACPPLVVLSPARYDPERRAAAALRARARERWRAANAPRTILWAGQPETADCLHTLSVLLPVLEKHGIALLFKAHPRDSGYPESYRTLLAASRVQWQDLTGMLVPDALALAPQLVLTQFSSVAVESGFHGIPSLHVLLPDAGGARLLEKTGYRIPPYCEAGAAAFVTGAEAFEGELLEVIGSTARRESIVNCFDVYFSTGAATLPALVARLKSIGAAG